MVQNYDNDYLILNTLILLFARIILLSLISSILYRTSLSVVEKRTSFWTELWLGEASLSYFFLVIYLSVALSKYRCRYRSIITLGSLATLTESELHGKSMTRCPWDPTLIPSVFQDSQYNCIIGPLACECATWLEHPSRAFLI